MTNDNERAKITSPQHFGYLILEWNQFALTNLESKLHISGLQSCTEEMAEVCNLILIDLRRHDQTKKLLPARELVKHADF